MYEKRPFIAGTGDKMIRGLMGCATDFFWRSIFRVLTTFQSALLFVMALLANSMIQSRIDETDVSSRTFIWFGALLGGSVLLSLTIEVLVELVQERLHVHITETQGPVIRRGGNSL